MTVQIRAEAIELEISDYADDARYTWIDLWLSKKELDKLNDLSRTEIENVVGDLEIWVLNRRYKFSKVQYHPSKQNPKKQYTVHPTRNQKTKRIKMNKKFTGNYEVSLSADDLDEVFSFFSKTLQN